MGSRSLCRPARGRISLSGLEASSHNEKLQDTIPASHRRAILFGERPAGQTPSLHTRLAWIQAAPFFRGLSLGQCAEIATTGREETIPSGDHLYRQGDSASFVFIIASGLIKITQLTESGKEVILRVKGSGELVGGAELLTGRTHRSSAETIEPCQLLVWEASTFKAYWTRFPVLLDNAVNILDQRLRLLEECFRDLATERVPQRVARTLLRLLERSGNPTHKGPIYLSCEELAQMTGTTLFTISRLLCQWAEWGILQPESKAIMVDNLPALINVARGTEGLGEQAHTAADDTSTRMRAVTSVRDSRPSAASRNIVA